MADQDDMIRKVQALWARADHPNTPEAERESCIRKARDLMAKYAIDELVLSEATAVKEAVVLSDIRIFKEDAKTLVPDQRIYLAHILGVNNRCRAVIRRMGASVSQDGAPIEAGTYLTLCGFKSDCDTVRSLYTLLGEDMILAMMDEPTDHMSKADRNTYFTNFCDGYVTRIDQRLREVKAQVETLAEAGSLLPVLRSREVEVADMFSRMFPNLQSQKVARMKYDPNAQARGKAAANNADIGGTKVGRGGESRKELS